MLTPVRLPSRRLVALWLLSLFVGIFVLVYRGPGWKPLRAHGGDVAIIPFLYFALGMVTRWSSSSRAWVVGSVALGVELLQALRLPVGRGLAVELTLGSTFDPLDLLAYAVGLALALAAEPFLRPQSGPPAPPPPLSP